jgi:DNA-directed RNA polymerase specialized sigma24 family protein
LRLIAGLSLAQVAGITGRSVGAVKLLQYRAVHRLAVLLEVDRSRRNPAGPRIANR